MIYLITNPFNFEFGFSGDALNFLKGTGGHDGFWNQIVDCLKAMKVPVIGISFWALIVGSLGFGVLGACLNKIFSHGVISGTQAGYLHNRSSKDKVQKKGGKG